MTTLTKSLLALIGAVVIGGFIWGAYQYPQAQILAGTSPVGTVTSTAKLATVSVAPATPGNNATSTSIQNTDANDRYITGLRAGCEIVGTSKTAYTGAGLAALLLSVATSSTASPATNSNVNIVGSTAMTIGTSTAFFAEASTTASNGPTGGSNLVSNIWAAGSYLTFTFNATNTAACQVGADYMQS